MNFSLLEISRTDEVVRYGLFLDSSVDPDGEGIASFDFRLTFDPLQASYVTGSPSYPADFFGFTNEADAGNGVLIVGAFSLQPFVSFDDPLIAFELDVTGLIGPGNLLLDEIFIDGAGLPATELIYTPVPNTSPEGSVTITGEAIVDGTLTASNTLTDPDVMGLVSYQWYADGELIEGAVGPDFQPSLAVKGATLTVVASYIDGNAFPESVSSEPTVPVTNPGDVIEGTTEADQLVGGERDDTLIGLEGRDTLRGNGGDDDMRGGEGIDEARYSGRVIDFSLVRSDNEIAVSGPEAAGNDLLTDVERLRFDDLSVAFDLDGNAGNSAKLLGVALGKDDWYDRQLVGIGIDIFDNFDLSFEEIMDLAFSVIIGPNPSNQQVVNLIYTNLVGQAPAQGELNALTADLLDNGAFTQGELGVFAAEFELNTANIDLVGLSQSGLEYIPVG